MSMLKGVLSNSMRPWLRARAQSSSIAVRPWLIEIADNPSIDIAALYTALINGEKEKYVEAFEKEVLGKTELGKAIDKTQLEVFEEFTKALMEYNKLKESMALSIESHVELTQPPPGKDAPIQEEALAKAPEGAQSSQEEEAILRELPSKTKVFVEKELYVVNNWRFILKIDSKKVAYTPKTPAEAFEIRNKYDLREIREEAIKEILEKKGLNVKINTEDPVESIEPVPYLYAYLMNNKSFVGLSRIKLGLGEQDARLRPITIEEYERLREELGPELSRLGERIVKALGIKYSPGSDEPFSASRLYVYWIERGIPEEVLEKLLKTIYPRAIELWNKLEAHELLKAIYKAMILPWPHGEDLPHILLITPTRSGKSGLYYLATGEEPYINATSVSLVGGYDSNSRSFIIGKLHGRDIAIQIESIETDKARDLAEYLVEYMRAGKTRRSVLGRDVKVEGSAPLIFTGNPASEGKRGLKLQDWINYGLLKNPDALGSRLLLFYITEAPRLEEIPEELLGKMRIVWEIARSSYIKRLIAEKWESPEVRAWLKESDAKIPIPVASNESLAVLFKYLSELAIHYWRGLKALALQIAIADNLHRLGEIGEEELISEADKSYIFLKDWLVKSIEVAVSDIAQNIYSDINVRVRTWPGLLQKAIIGINIYLNNKAINSGRAEIPIRDLLRVMGERGYIKLGKGTNPYLSYPKRLKDYIKQKERELGEIGVSLAESTNTIVVDVEAFKKLDIEELIINVEKSGKP